jgi:hypothetical protein
MKLLIVKSSMRNRWNVLALTTLGLVFGGMCLYLILNPSRTGVVPPYRGSSVHWWAAEGLYEPGTHGFLYVPAFAILFTPFNHIQPTILGEIIWRFFGFGVFGFGLWKLANLCGMSERQRREITPAFAILVFLAVPASLASLNNGQTNLLLSAVVMLAALALRNEKWNLAGLLISFALVLKPISLGPWLLTFAIFKQARRPLLLGMVGALGFGFLHPDIKYAWGQNISFIEKLVRCYTPENLRVSDLFGALQKWGVTTSPGLEKAIRAAASLAALGFVWWRKDRAGSLGGSWAIWVASSLILTIFNPRVETNSYVLISPLIAFAAVSYWRQVEGQRWKGAILALACIGLMCDGMGKPIYLATDVWFKPMIVLLVSPLLFRIPASWRA